MDGEQAKDTIKAIETVFDRGKGIRTFEEETTTFFETMFVRVFVCVFVAMIGMARKFLRLFTHNKLPLYHRIKKKTIMKNNETGLCLTYSSEIFGFFYNYFD